MAKRMKMAPYCQRRNCSPLNVLSEMYSYVDIAGHSPQWGMKQTNACWGMCQNHSPDGTTAAAFLLASFFVFR